MQDQSFSLINTTLVTPDEVLTSAELTVSGGHIAALERTSTAAVLRLHDHLVYPGLLNAHDHLFGTWWPRVAPNRPYANVYQWLADYDESAVLVERNHNSADDMYAFGAYRNMVAGSTTVADHFMRLGEADFYSRYPIDVLYRYGRTWTVRKETSWGDDISTEYGRAVRSGQPYIIHLAEGIDAETAQEMDVLTARGAVGRNTMVVHGIGLRPVDVALLAGVGASVCWCPVSNLYLYEQTADIPALLRAGVSVTLGTDSAMTGGLNLLDEARTARKVYRDVTGDDPSPRWLAELVTTRAAYALVMDDRRGRIAVGYEADLLVLPDGGQGPYAALIEAEPKDIALLIRGGIPVYGDRVYHDLFERLSPSFAPALISGRPKLIAGDLPGLLERMSNQVGKPIDFPFLPFSPSEAGTHPS